MEIEFGDKLKPVTSIIVFQDNNNFYLEKKEIVEVNNKYHLVGGKPLENKDLADIFTCVKIDATGIYSKGLLSKNLLVWNDNNIIWLWKSNKVNLYFTKEVGLKDAVYHLPNLIFRLSGNTLYVYATKTTNINNDTKLFYAPVFNCYNDSRICMGNVNIDAQGDINDVINKVTKQFFRSTFTTSLNNSVYIKREYKRQYKLLKAKKEYKFDNKTLSIKKTIFKDLY